MSVESMNVQQVVRPTGGVKKAIASTFVPGLGQLCDGRYKNAAVYSICPIGLAVASDVVIANKIYASATRQLSKMTKNSKIAKVLENVAQKLEKPLKGRPYIALGLLAAAIGVHVAGIMDAYKGESNKA